MDQDTDSPVSLSIPVAASTPTEDAARSAEAGGPSARVRRGGGDWIEGRLKSLYDAVAAEPLTPELQELVDRLRRGE
jgi:hypothetical protein